MTLQPFLIADTRIGIERDLEPWLLPNDAYPDLQDAYIWRGRVHKRKGFQFLARLRRIIGTTNGAGDRTITLLNIPLAAGVSQFVCGAETYQDNGSAGAAQNLLSTGVGVATLNRTTGVFVLTGGPAATDVFYLPGLPVMGLRSLETATENEDSLIGFDTSYSYLFTGGVFQDLTSYKTSTAPFIWHGANYDLFWTNNYVRAMFTTNGVGNAADLHNFLDGSTITAITQAASAVVTVANGANFSQAPGDIVFFNEVAGMTQINGLSATVTNVAGNNVTVNINSTAFTAYTNGGVLFNLTRNIGNGANTGDSIKWLDQDKSGWVNFQPSLNGAGNSTNYLQSAEMIFPYKNRLLVLNTLEGTFTGTAQNYYQRARWSQNGTVYYSTPIPTNFQGVIDAQSWRDDVVGKGGYIDAPTLEQITSAQFVKDTLIVYFERSTWQLRYTGNELLPFIWEKINTELGAESTFSVVPFDKTTIALGNVGIHACDSVNVERIDEKIPDEIFNIQNNNQGPMRVVGVRDYFYEFVYWSVPYSGIDTEDGMGTPVTFIFPNKLIVYNYKDNSFSFFNDSFTCFGYYQATNPIIWGSLSVKWNSYDALWSDPEADNPFTLNIAGGNQQGFVEILMQQSTNDQSLFISNIAGSTITCPNHNLQPGQFVKILTATGINYGVGPIFKVITITDANNFVINSALTGVFTGSGTLAVVNNMSILTKRFNPFIEQGVQVRLVRADLYLDKTTNGQISVNLYINEDSSTPINRAVTFPLSTVNAPITAITAANPCVVTLGNAINISVNDVVFITAVNGMTQINQFSAIVTAINGLNITLGLDSSTFTAYTNGGTLWDVSKNNSNVVNTFPETTYQTSPDRTLVNAKLWKRINFHDVSQLFQFKFTYSDSQMVCDPIVSEDFVLHGIMLYFSPAGRLLDV